jgi:hypothetical protein
MRRHSILLLPLLLGMMPLPAQALPTEAEISTLAQRFCTMQNPSEQDFENAFVQGLGEWLQSGSITFADMQNEEQGYAVGEAIGEQIAVQMLQTCPDKLMEMEQLGMGSN